MIQPTGQHRTNNHQDRFDPHHSELERDPAKLSRYVTMLENALGHQARVTGILEIGSYAKGEAVPSSDIDTRVYVTSPAAYLFNVFGQLEPPRYSDFVRECGRLPRLDLTWDDFNDVVATQISDALWDPSDSPAGSIEFGFVDQRYAEFELEHLDDHPSLEHSLLFQSNILYDPTGFLEHHRRRLRGAILAALVAFYHKQLLNRLTRRLPAFLEPHPWDAYKLDKSGQLQWVQQAVRCLRNAVALKTYARTGTFLYKKADVLDDYRQHLPDDFPFVQTLYDWKTDPQVRADMVAAFREDKNICFKRFQARMPRLKAIVKKVIG
ncbi:MAG: hypothetical protein JXA89_03370 [Anaerolineae bacterium]|nr:hypothetical protein [Anaerolineae bacterium]